VLDDDAFTGGFSAPRNYRGRTARWLYGALSPYGQMTASFTVEGPPGAGTLLLKGIDSENGDKTPIAIQVNDTVVFQGGNPLPKDDWRGPVAPWGEATIPLPAGTLRAGRNTLTISNLAPASNFNAPPYFMLDEAVITYEPASGGRPSSAGDLTASSAPRARPAPNQAPAPEPDAETDRASAHTAPAPNPAPPAAGATPAPRAPAPLLARPASAEGRGGGHGEARGHDKEKERGRRH
jgi:hypothetical protein